MAIENMLFGKAIYVLFLIYAATFIVAGKIADRKKRHSKRVAWLITFFAPVMLIGLLFFKESDVDRNENLSIWSLVVLIIILLSFYLTMRVLPHYLPA